jgi:hypothetical protein
MNGGIVAVATVAIEDHSKLAEMLTIKSSCGAMPTQSARVGQLRDGMSFLKRTNARGEPAAHADILRFPIESSSTQTRRMI